MGNRAYQSVGTMDKMAIKVGMTYITEIQKRLLSQLKVMGQSLISF